MAIMTNILIFTQPDKQLLEHFEYVQESRAVAVQETVDKNINAFPILFDLPLFPLYLESSDHDLVS